jgi:hypothetical protein
VSATDARMLAAFIAVTVASSRGAVDARGQGKDTARKYKDGGRQARARRRRRQERRPRQPRRRRDRVEPARRLKLEATARNVGCIRRWARQADRSSRDAR